MDNKQKKNILGVDIFCGSKEEAENIIFGYMIQGRNDSVVTANPEIVLKAVDDGSYGNILNSASLVLADGFGLKIAGWIMGKNFPRITGADLCHKIMAKAELKNKAVCLLFWTRGLSGKEDIEKAVKNKYPGLKFKVIGIERNMAEDQQLMREINNFGGEILFVGLGAPWQEKFISRNIKKMPSAKLAIGVGGSFDFITGKIKRAPKAMQLLGLEWLWRFFAQIRKKNRRKRIYTAVIIFPLKFIKWRLAAFFKKTPEY